MIKGSGLGGRVRCWGLRFEGLGQDQDDLVGNYTFSGLGVIVRGTS